MTKARNQQICLDITPYYHCTTRCVRQAFLCGYDKKSNRNFDNRKGWIEQLLISLNKAFCIDVAAYSIMCNHYHVTLKVDTTTSLKISDKEIVTRWLMIYKGNQLARRFSEGEKLSDDESRLLRESVKLWRSELTNISRFMAQINEKIARWANKEDNCKGRFWQARFDSQAILDIQTLLRTMVYDDLNPVRAKVAPSPEESRFTSVRRRLMKRDHGLIPFREEASNKELSSSATLPITFREYLEVLDWTGRQYAADKRGVIPSDFPAILERLQYSPKNWMNGVQRTTSWSQKAIGSKSCIKRFCDKIGQKWIWQNELLIS